MSRNNISLFDHRILAGVVLAPAATQTTTEIFQLGKTEKQGVDWDVSSGATIGLRIEILQSNDQAGPFVKWSNPSAAGTTVINTLNSAVANDGSDLQIPPSGFCKVRITNTGAASLTINRITFFIQ